MPRWKRTERVPIQKTRTGILSCKLGLESSTISCPGQLLAKHTHTMHTLTLTHQFEPQNSIISAAGHHTIPFTADEIAAYTGTPEDAEAAGWLQVDDDDVSDSLNLEFPACGECEFSRVAKITYFALRLAGGSTQNFHFRSISSFHHNTLIISSWYMIILSWYIARAYIIFSKFDSAWRCVAQIHNLKKHSNHDTHSYHHRRCAACALTLGGKFLFFSPVARFRVLPSLPRVSIVNTLQLRANFSDVASFWQNAYPLRLLSIALPWEMHWLEDEGCYCWAAGHVGLQVMCCEARWLDWNGDHDEWNKQASRFGEEGEEAKTCAFHVQSIHAAAPQVTNSVWYFMSYRKCVSCAVCLLLPDSQQAEKFTKKTQRSITRKRSYSLLLAGKSSIPFSRSLDHSLAHTLPSFPSAMIVTHMHTHLHIQIQIKSKGA